MKSASTPDRDAYLRLILRGSIGGTADPIIKIVYLDTDEFNNPIIDGMTMEQAQVDITQYVIRAEVVLERDDRRTDSGLLLPPAGTLSLTLGNSKKIFTPNAENEFSDKIAIGRIFKAFLGFKVQGTDEFFDMGEFIADEPSFDVSPGATARVTCRDKIGTLLQQEISVTNLGPIDADDYIVEVLKRAGFNDTDFQTAPGMPSFASTPVFRKRKVGDILTEVLLRLQLDGRFRIIQLGSILKLIEVPSTGVAQYVLNWIRDIGARFQRNDRMNQARRRTTVKKNADPAASEDSVAATASGTEASLPVTIPFASANPWIRVIWIQPSSETLRLIEVSRTADEIVLDRRDPSGTGSWSVQVRGDQVTDGSPVGEAANGSLIERKRGKTDEFVSGFISTSVEAQALAEELQDRFGNPSREVEFDMPNAWVLGEINDLFRVLEKYSGDRDIYHLSRIAYTYQAIPARLRCVMRGQFSGIEEEEQKYDRGFQYDAGRTYDERFPIGEESTQDLTLRGATVVRSR